MTEAITSHRSLYRPSNVFVQVSQSMYVYYIHVYSECGLLKGNSGQVTE